MDKNIHSFLKELLHDAGQTGLGTELEEIMIQDLATRLEDRLILVSAQYLTPAQQNEVQKMTDSNDAIAYLKNAIPDFEQIVSQALLDFREVYITASKGA